MTRLSHARTLSAPSLAAIGVYLLIGCIPLPGDFRKEDGGPRPEERIGKAGDDRPLALGHSTLSRVVAVLGPWSDATADQRAVAYRYTVRTGTIVFPLCFMAEPVSGGRLLVLRFGDDGALQSFKVYGDSDEVPELAEFKKARRQRWLEEVRRRNAGLEE